MKRLLKFFNKNNSNDSFSAVFKEIKSDQLKLK